MSTEPEYPRKLSEEQKEVLEARLTKIYQDKGPVYSPMDYEGVNVYDFINEGSPWRSPNRINR